MDNIKKYVDRFFLSTKKNSKYEMSFSEMECGIKEILCATDINKAFRIITIFFDFGYAKGYRAALSKIKKGGAASCR